MLLILSITALLLLVSLGVIIAMQPASFCIARSALILARPEIVFSQVNTLAKWKTLSLWSQLDPNATLAFVGPAEGPGAVCTWIGNHRVGEGRLMIVESRLNEMIRMQLEFSRPVTSKADVEFTFKTDGQRTGLIWKLSGQCSFAQKAIRLLMHMDRLVGRDLERALADLKKATEQEPLAGGAGSEPLVAEQLRAAPHQEDGPQLAAEGAPG